MNENPLSHILEYNLDLGKTKPSPAPAAEPPSVHRPPHDPKDPPRPGTSAHRHDRRTPGTPTRHQR